MLPPQAKDKSISVLVADENRMGCQLLASSLQRTNSFKVVGCAVTVEEVLSVLRHSEAEVAVISATLQNGSLSGFRLLRELRISNPKTRIVVLLDTAERDLVVDAFRGGAKGVFCRSQSFKALCKCITSVHNGQIWASSAEVQFLLEALGEVAPLHIVNSRGKSLLSKREEEVVACVAEGLTNREISAKLNLSEHTVKNYLFRIFDKLGISSRVELVLYALSNRENTAPHAGGGESSTSSRESSKQTAKSTKSDSARGGAGLAAIKDGERH